MASSVFLPADVRSYIFDTALMEWVPWDGSLSTGGLTIGTVDQGAAGVDPWLVTMGTTDLTPAAPTVAVVGAASAQAVAANASRKGLSLRNVSTSGQRISLGFGQVAVLDSGDTLYPRDVFYMDGFSFDLGAVNAIASGASAALTVQEWAS